jgi:hypothetical protein
METIQVNEIEKAKQLLKEDEKKRIQSFIQEYTELVKKYGVEIKPKTDLIISPATQEM